MRQVTYQIGVDFLGFPIYVIHTIYQSKTAKKDNGNPKKQWVTVESETVKYY